MEKRERKGSSDLPTFEYDGLQKRFRTVSKSWSLPCNLYLFLSTTIFTTDNDFTILLKYELLELLQILRALKYNVEVNHRP